MFWLYILQSDSSGRYYIGSTNSPDRRILEHNSGQTKSTRGRGPWVLVYQEGFETKEEACLREREIKSWKSHRSVEELIEERSIAAT